MKIVSCLNLDCEFGDVEVIEVVEKAFDIKFGSHELASCETVGQMFDVVQLKIAAKSLNRRDERILCPSTLAFYRLRSALGRVGHSQSVTPSTDLRLIYKRFGAKRLHRALAHETELRLPELTLHSAAASFLLLLFATSLVIAVFVGSPLPLLAGFGLVACLQYLLPMQLPDRIATTGDFVRYFTALNFAKFAQLSGGARTDDVWTALRILIAEVEGEVPYSLIGRKTRFFPNHNFHAS